MYFQLRERFCQAYKNLETVPSGAAFKCVNLKIVLPSQQTRYKTDTVEIKGWQYLPVRQE